MADPLRALAALRQHGRHATSFQTLEPGRAHWFDPRAPASFVAYVRVGRVRVAVGPPVAPPGAEGEVAARFVDDARRAGDQVAFFSADAPFLAALRAAGVAHAAIPIGVQPEWSPAHYTTGTRRRRTLRAQIRRAARKGVRVSRVDPADGGRAGEEVRRRLARLADVWLATRKLPPMRFMVDVAPFDHAAERRYYVAEKGGRLVGALIAVPVYARRGWFFEDVLRAPDAPQGTVEALVDAALSEARDRGDAYATLGLAPLARIPKGPGPHRALRWFLRACFARLGPLYPFAGLFAFKRRFAPHAWTRQYLVVVPPSAAVTAILAVLRAFAGGRLAPYAAEALRRALGRIPRRAWAIAVLTMGALLVPWTLALARADGVFWFGAVAIQRAWVVFDVFMASALGALAYLLFAGRMSAARRLSSVLGVLASADLLLTATELAQLHGRDVGWHRVVGVAGVLGPFVATVLLVGLANVTSAPAAPPPR